MIENIEKGNNNLEENSKIIKSYSDSENTIQTLFNDFMAIIDYNIEDYNRCIKNMNENKKIYDEALL